MLKRYQCTLYSHPHHDSDNGDVNKNLGPKAKDRKHKARPKTSKYQGQTNQLRNWPRTRYVKIGGKKENQS